mmetsp:Transcript_29437/g.94933  ORF Transcript_29437/g.94933 Transcript_29437/m.94933 type:complete len:308 (-) Transcript_29437:886-1809(-)
MACRPASATSGGSRGGWSRIGAVEKSSKSRAKNAAVCSSAKKAPSRSKEAASFDWRYAEATARQWRRPATWSPMRFGEARVTRQRGQDLAPSYDDDDERIRPLARRWRPAARASWGTFFVFRTLGAGGSLGLAAATTETRGSIRSRARHAVARSPPFSARARQTASKVERRLRPAPGRMASMSFDDGRSAATVDGFTATHSSDGRLRLSAANIAAVCVHDPSSATTFRRRVDFFNAMRPWSSSFGYSTRRSSSRTSSRASRQLRAPQTTNRAPSWPASRPELVDRRNSNGWHRTTKSPKKNVSSSSR